MLVLLCENLVVVLVVVCRSLLPQMVPLSRSWSESGGLGLTWLDHQGRVSHVDVTAPGESDRGPGHGDSDWGPWPGDSRASTPVWCNSEGIAGVPYVEEEWFCWALGVYIYKYMVDWYDTHKECFDLLWFNGLLPKSVMLYLEYWLSNYPSCLCLGLGLEWRVVVYAR